MDRMNALKLKTTTTPAPTPYQIVTKVDPRVKSPTLADVPNPGAMTSPSAQGPVRPGTQKP
jgi:hypothetical protein